MATMATFCRITGHARNLPKPCYFPLLPPISPADAKKLCRITGRASLNHNYTPILAFGKPIKFDGVIGCRITQHENFCFHIIAPFKNKENNKDYKLYKELITKVKSKKNRTTDTSKSYVYSLPNDMKKLILPPIIEEAIRIGEVEYISLSNGSDHIALKVRQGRLIKVAIEKVASEEVSKLDNLYYGEGPNETALEEQQNTVKERKRRKSETLAKRQVFEDKDKRADEEEIKSKEKIKSKKPRVVFDLNKRKEKRTLLETMLIEEKDNKAILPPRMKRGPKEDPDEPLKYQKMFTDVKTAQAYAIKLNVVGATDFNPMAVDKADRIGIDWDQFPHEEAIEPIEITPSVDKPSALITDSNVHSLDIVASAETIEPVSKINPQLARQISTMEPEKLKTTENVTDKIMEMKCSDMLPSLADVGTITETQPSELSYGFLVSKDQGSEFISKEKYIPSETKAISGVMVAVENELKFVSGQIIHLAEQESFVAGQTIETSEGQRFIPGQTLVNDEGTVTFIPGTVASSKTNKKSFASGRLVERTDGPVFMPGQMVDKGDGKPVFATGQTVITEDGPKFVPGEVVSDSDGEHDFVPGISVSYENGNKFIPGQVFQLKEGLAITPGQIVNTYEGPSFIPGTCIETPKGDRKFVQGNTLTSEDGKISFERQDIDIPLIKEDLIIPTRDLHLLAEANHEVIGFNVKPSNTVNLKIGDRLYGDIVEMDDSVLFYLTGKLPENRAPGAKVISGELRVSENSQRFIPGRKLGSPSGEKFVPGQVVITEHGEEFVPGQIVETSDGPKFVPGQVIMTSDGEKFVPGQVIVHDEGPKFVPGQIIQTENGATFIPGQMMNTDEGRKFVPGQLIDTKEGPMFVPGQVLETTEGPKFVPGIIVETDEGLKYVPSEADDQDDDMEFTFQGFDMTPEELILLSQSVDDTNRHSPVCGQQGVIDSSTLKKLAAENMVIHGRSPEPSAVSSSKSKRNVGFESPDADEVEENPSDDGTDKLQILNGLRKAESTYSEIRRKKEYTKVLDIIGGDPENSDQSAAIHAINYILETDDTSSDMFTSFIGNDESLVAEILKGIGSLNNIERNDQVRKLVLNSLRSIITTKCNNEIKAMMKDSQQSNLFSDPRSQILLTEAVGIVCITGDMEAAELLEEVLSEKTDPSCLRDDKDIIRVLRQLLVLHEIGERDPDVEQVLLQLRRDPEGVKDKKRVHSLIKAASTLLRKEEEPKRSFDIRHVASSKDIPNELFEQIKEDKDQAEQFIEDLPDELFYAIMGDNRCGEKLLDALDTPKVSRTMRELNKFKKGMAVVVIKENMQAVIPRSCARSVCYGIIPYVLIDEEGFKFFERGLTGRKLAPGKVIENTWFDDSYCNGYYPQTVASSGQQYSMMLLGQHYNYNQPSLQYTSLLPSSGPTRLSYPEASRRSSRESSVVPSRIPSRATTPSRRSSIASNYEPYINNTYEPSYSRRSSVSLPVRPMSPIDTAALERDFRNVITTESALVPYVNDEQDETPSVKRSDTVANLLEKYTNFSVEKEFDKPIVGRKHPANEYLYLDDSDDDDYTSGHKKGFPLGGKGRRSLITPERSTGKPKQNGHSRRHKTRKLVEEPNEQENRKLSRPFSDIFEVDEPEGYSAEPTFVPRSSKQMGSKKKIKPKRRTDPLENGFTPFPARGRTSISPLSDDEDLECYQINKPNRPRLSSVPASSHALDLRYGDDRRSRRRSEPRYTPNYLTESSPAGGLASRSRDRDASPLSYTPSYETKHKSRAARYKPLADLDDGDSETTYDAYNPYKSSYLSNTRSAPIDDDFEERPSYKLLGKRYQSPYSQYGAQRRYTSPICSGPYGGGMPSYGTGAPSYGSGMPSYGNGMPSYNNGMSSYGSGGNLYGTGMPQYSNGGMPSYGTGASAYGTGAPSYGTGAPSYGTGAPSYGSGAPSYGSATPSRYGGYESPNYGRSNLSMGGMNPSPYTGGYSPYVGASGGGGSYGLPTRGQQFTSHLGGGTGTTPNYGVAPRGSRETSLVHGGVRPPPRNKPIDPRKYLDDPSDGEEDEDMPRLSIPKRKQFDASKYLNDDLAEDLSDDYNDAGLGYTCEDDVMDGDCGSRDDQRKLASDIAKKYMRSFSLERDDEDQCEDEDDLSS